MKLLDSVAAHGSSGLLGAFGAVEPGSLILVLGARELHQSRATCEFPRNAGARRIGKVTLDKNLMYSYYVAIYAQKRVSITHAGTSRAGGLALRFRV